VFRFFSIPFWRLFFNYLLFLERNGPRTSGRGDESELTKRIMAELHAQLLSDDACFGPPPGV
jgi:hypothetical protein